MYRISYMWYTFFGASVAILVAHLAMVVFGQTDRDATDPVLIAPFLRKFYTPEKPQILPDDQPAKCRVQLAKLAPLQDESAF